MISTKKGVSIMVSYILLIVIALSLSVLVYAFLNLYVPKEKPECIEGISVIVEETQCVNKELSVKLKNTGRFKISASYIRIGKENREFREWINNPEEISTPDSFYFFDAERSSPGLFPEESKTIGPLDASNIIDSLPGSYILEVQPAIFSKGERIEDLALCSSISQKVYCE